MTAVARKRPIGLRVVPLGLLLEQLLATEGKKTLLLVGGAPAPESLIFVGRFLRKQLQGW